MTPLAFSGDYAFVDFVDDCSYFDSVNNASAARAVISLNSNAISAGSGTMTDPFVVG